MHIHAGMDAVAASAQPRLRHHLWHRGDLQPAQLHQRDARRAGEVAVEVAKITGENVVRFDEERVG
jgi:hypothetical protein